MIKKVTYIFRNRLANYNSIEELFSTIIETLNEKIAIDKIELPRSGAGISTLLENIYFVRSLKLGDVIHITGDVHYMSLINGKKTVLTIHDVYSVIKGNLLKRIYIRFFWFTLPSLFVNRITVISNFTKAELSKVVPFATSKIRVIHNPVSKIIAYSPKKFNYKRPLILLIGTKQNKNLERVIKALSDVSCELIIIGKLTEIQLKLLDEIGLVYSNMFNISFEKIVESYKTCDLVLFASTYEGFGMPIIEAQATGRVVITSNLGAMKEISGNGAFFVDPYDIDSISRGVRRVITEKKLRNDLIEKGSENVKRFQFDFIANQYLELYREVANG